jgi:hypothetical protein
MNNPSYIAARYHYVRLIAIAIAMYIFFEGVLTASITTNMKLILGVLLGISIFLVNMIFAKKINSLVCPNCQKPIAVKTKFGKLLTSNSCEYCRYGFG